MTDVDDVAPELRGPLRRTPTVNLQNRFVLAFSRAATRFAPTTRTDGFRTEEVRDGDTKVRLYRPTGRITGAGLLWIHGGGMVAGDPAMDDQMLGQVVRKLGVVVASVHYRRAPEHPYPMPLNDCLGGWQWLQHNADRLGVDRARIGIGGESAGGGLAATLVHRLHDESPGRVRAQWLMCPMLDDRTAARTDISGRAHRIWNNRNNRFGWHSYLGVEPGSERVPDGAVPARRTNLRGLPPTWIGIAGLDLFAAENLAYAHRLREAGVAVETDVVDGAYHGFQTVAAGTKLVEDYLGRATNWLGQALGAESNVCF